jgi:enoyl-CoA hydratase
MNYFNLSIDQHIAHLKMVNPDALNTMSPAWWQQLDQHLSGLQRGNQARALVLSSTGKHFTAGMSLDVFSSGIGIAEQTAASRANIVEQLMDMQTTFNRLEALRMPVIAAIQGGCIGGGVDLISACDIRLCTSDAFFCIQEINIGMTADLGTLQRLPKLIPEGVVRELAYTGRRLSSARALSVGLVNDVLIDNDALIKSAMAMAAEIASKPPVAVWGSKQAIQYARDHSTADSLRQMGWLQGAIWDTAAMTEAHTANKEKRAPQYAALEPITRFMDEQ